MKKIQIAAIVFASLAPLTCSSAARAAAVDFKVLIDGVAAPAFPTPMAISVGQHTLTVQGRVTNNEVIPGQAGGFIQASFDLSDSANHIHWAEGTGFLGNPNGNWASTANAAFVNHNSGVLADTKHDVVAETGSIPPSNWDTQFNTVGANVFSTLATGNFTLDSYSTVLRVSSVVANQSVATLNGAAIGGKSPDTVTNFQVNITDPEPASMTLAGLGAISMLVSRRRMPGLKRA